jgi:peptidoglycan/LPS O-acetylase OafA/YrhL
VNLDLLRSFAVLSVFIAHIYVQFESARVFPFNASVDRFLRGLSFTGVMFFFVHTSLVLMLSMHRSPAARLGRNFWIRRFFRIYPLCWAVILFVLLTGLTDEAGASIQALGWRGVLINLALVHNVIRGYTNVIGPLWSLDWEVQMYLVLPLFFWAMKRLDRLFVVFAFWTGSTLLAIVATQPVFPRFFHGAIFPPMFIGGMVAYKLLHRRSFKISRALPAWGFLLLLLVLFAVEGSLAAESTYETPRGAGINSCICLILAFAISNFVQIRTQWIVRSAHLVAKYSYGIYLLHIPAIMFVLHYMTNLPPLLKIISAAVLTTLLSVVAFHTIEDPFIRIGKGLNAGGVKAGATQAFRSFNMRHGIPAEPGAAE